MTAARSLVALAAVSTLATTGCQHSVLQRKTGRQASGLPDLYYQQVLDNLARFSANPNELPHFAYAGAGTTQVQRTAGSGSSFASTGTLTAFFFSGLSFTPNLSQTTSEAWSTVASVEPDELYLMRCVYQRAVGACPADGEQAVQQFFGPAHIGLPAMQPGWYCVGGRHDVPKHAAHVGRHGDTYVWVAPDQVDNLARLVVTMVDVATADVAELTKRTTAADPDKRKREELEAAIAFKSAALKGYPQPLSPGAVELERALDKDVFALLELNGQLDPDRILRDVPRTGNAAVDAERVKGRQRLIDEAKERAKQPPRQPRPDPGPVPARQRRLPFAPFYPPLQPLNATPQ